MYVSDLEDWLDHAISLTYADDTSTSVSGKNIADVLRKLEIDAKNVLKFMTANGLHANPSKTTFIIIKFIMKQKDMKLFQNVGFKKDASGKCSVKKYVFF